VAPDAGEAKLGAAVEMGYFAQHQMEQLDGNATVLEELQAYTRTIGIGPLRNAAGAFGFQGHDVEKRVSVLSGGERARLALLKIMFDTPNLLVLDEPTNHLDLATKRALIRTLSNYEGTIIFVSHDRAFLRAMATHVLELGAAGPHVYPGSYDEYVGSTGHEAPGMRAV
jgi:ATPase subunit of ABC transporter with duplicated ATPase domains